MSEASKPLPLVKIEDTRQFQIFVVSHDERATSFLLPSTHEKLGRFKDVTLVRRISDLYDIYRTGEANKKTVVFVDVSENQPLHELKEMIYLASADKRGLLFAFSFLTLSDTAFEELITVGFDDAFDLQGDDSRKHMRMYSWMRRFVATYTSQEVLERESIISLGRKETKIVGKWKIIGHEKAAVDADGQRIGLTQQEVDFLTLLSHGPETTESPSYNKFFKAPHAIVHKLKKKLGTDLPVCHDGDGRYHLKGAS
ncbi:hypothetical protein [Bradyrhizobium sp. OAE829]|uniref:hypothetical protein n=1 Tax=Bradyrhizobium sp. OAE829 TaxID=2663807 RepID=UPI00178B023D